MQFRKRTCNNISFFLFVCNLLPCSFSAFYQCLSEGIRGWGWTHITLPIGRQLFNLRVPSSYGKLIVYLFYNQMHIFREVWKLHQLICTRHKQSDWNSMLVCSFILLFSFAPMTSYNIRFRITSGTISSTDQSTTGLSKYEVGVLQT
jgi:hypothetical protein